MAVVYNGNAITAMQYNGQEVRRCKYNGVTVFPTLTAAATQPTSALTSNTAPSPYRAYYSSNYSNTYAAYKAFTNAISTQGWASCSNNKNGTAWVALDLGSGKKLWDVKINLWNRNNANVNGAYNVAIYGTNTTPTNGTSSTFTEMPSDALPLGRFTGMDGDTSSKSYVLDCVGDGTTNCTRDENPQHRINATTYGFRYIIISSTSWNQDGGTYLSIGRININGYFES